MQTPAGAYHHLYNDRRWTGTKKRGYTDGLRMQTFIRDNFICQHTGELCSGKHPAPNSPVCNHIKRHEGNEELFFDPDNLETVTRAVHDGLIQSMEKGVTMTREDGWRP